MAGLRLDLTKTDRPESHERIRRILGALRPCEPELVYLFGSWARGEQDDLSDVDLVIIKKTEGHFFDRMREVQRLLPRGKGAVDILVYTPDEFAAMQERGNIFVEMILSKGVSSMHASR